MNVRKLKQLCERLFKLPAQQQALSAVDPANGSIMSLGHDDEAVLGSFTLLVRHYNRHLTVFQLMSLQFHNLHGPCYMHQSGHIS